MIEFKNISNTLSLAGDDYEVNLNLKLDISSDVENLYAPRVNYYPAMNASRTGGVNIAWSYPCLGLDMTFVIDDTTNLNSETVIAHVIDTFFKTQSQLGITLAKDQSGKWYKNWTINSTPINPWSFTPVDTITITMYMNGYSPTSNANFPLMNNGSGVKFWNGSNNNQINGILSFPITILHSKRSWTAANWKAVNITYDTNANKVVPVNDTDLRNCVSSKTVSLRVRSSTAIQSINTLLDIISDSNSSDEEPIIDGHFVSW